LRNKESLQEIKYLDGDGIAKSHPDQLNVKGEQC